MGNLAATNIPFLQDADSDEPRVSGAMGPDLMVRYDVEMDFSEEKLTYFSQDHCAAHILHWSSDAVTQVPISITARAKDYPPTMIPGAAMDLPPDFLNSLIARAVTPILGTDIRTQVMLDGHLFTANIDTGQDISTINSQAAQNSFGALADSHPLPTPESQQDLPAQAGTEAVTVTASREQRRFRSLTFGGVTVVNPLFVLKPAASGPHRVGDAKMPDITIGMNVLRKLHLYFAFGERMLYVSAAARQTQ